MRISIFGLGYVGYVSMACLADDSNHIVGVDVSISKVNLINAGSTRIVDKDIDALMKKAWESGNIEVTDDHKSALRDANVSIICVRHPEQQIRTSGSEQSSCRY